LLFVVDTSAGVWISDYLHKSDQYEAPDITVVLVFHATETLKIFKIAMEAKA
jgi:hypothetical protein